jgi:protein-disulfide isomerase
MIAAPPHLNGRPAAASPRGSIPAIIKSPYPERRLCLFSIRFLLCCVLVALAAGCRAQVPPNATVNRRIEILVRSQFNVPSNYDVILGGKTKSDIPGFDNLPITFSHNGKQTTVLFLISNDGNTLARLEKFDVSKDPEDALSIHSRPIRGNIAAKVTLVNFDDLECPYCARMHQELFPATMDHYKGQVRYIYKDFPLVEIHPWAMHAAVDSNCLADQNPLAYWNFVDYIHSHGQEISGGEQDPAKAFLNLDQAARDEGKRQQVNAEKLNACLQKQDQAAVRASMHDGEKLVIEGTPQVFINGERLNAGAVSTDMVWDSIDRALRAVGEQPPPREEAPKTPSADAQHPPAAPKQ